MAIVMNMSSYEIEERAAPDDRHEDYAVDRRLAMRLAVIGEPAETCAGRMLRLPPDLADVDIEAFLARMNER